MKHKTLYYGGHIITCNLRNEIAEAIVIEDDKILYVGEYETARYLIDADTEVVHIGGRAILPTFTDAMCAVWVGETHASPIDKTPLENLWEKGISSGITCFCDAGKGGEKAIAQAQIWLAESRSPLRLLLLCADQSSHPIGTLPACFSACGIRSGFGNNHCKIGHYLMDVEAPAAKEDYSLNTPFAMFLKHLISHGITVEFLPKNKAEAEYALWCLFYLSQYTASFATPKIYLFFPIDDEILYLLSRVKIQIVLSAQSFRYESSKRWDFLRNLRDFSKLNIPFSFAYGFSESNAPTPMELLSWLSLGNDSSASDELCFSIKESLQAMTFYGAMGALQEDVFGSLEWGKSADLILLSASPFSVQKNKIKDIFPLRVIAEGRIVYDTLPLPQAASSVYMETES